MSAERDMKMVYSGIIVAVVLLLIGVILFMRKRKDKTDDKNIKKSKENFSDTFYLSNVTERDVDRITGDKDIVENFPQTTPMNVMYSDANGNLSTTTDLGLQNLTIDKGGALLIGDKFRFNANSDYFKDDEWLRMSNPQNTDYYGGFAAGKLYGKADIMSDGTITVRGGGTISTGGNITAGSMSAGGALTAGSITINGYGDVQQKMIDLYGLIDKLSKRASDLESNANALKVRVDGNDASISALKTDKDAPAGLKSYIDNEIFPALVNNIKNINNRLNVYINTHP
jgi:hypothetical protein